MAPIRSALAIFMAVLAHVSSLSADTVSPVVLICNHADQVPEIMAHDACEALAETLAADLARAGPARQLQRGGPVPDGAVEVTFTVTSATRFELSARLTWHQGAQSGASPEISLSVQDAELSVNMYQPFFAHLVRLSKLQI